MGFIGDWRRSILGAGGVALLLPLGLTLGVALTAAFGGETTLRALGQVLAGPASVTRPAGEGLESAARLPAVPVRADASRSGASRDRGSQTAPSGGDRGPGPSAGPGDPAPNGPSPEPAPPGPAEPPSPPDAGPAPPAAEPAPAPGGGLGETADEVTGLLPAPLGDVAGSAVDTVVDLIP